MFGPCTDFACSGGPRLTTLRDTQEMAVRVNRIYCTAHGIRPTSDWYLLKLQEEVGEAAAAYLASRGANRRATSGEHLSEELADVICFALLIAHDNDIDIDLAIHKKWACYDQTLP